MSRPKPRTRRNRPVLPLTPEQTAETADLREQTLARLEVLNAERIAKGWSCCPDCGGLSPPLLEEASHETRRRGEINL